MNAGRSSRFHGANTAREIPSNFPDVDPNGFETHRNPQAKNPWLDTAQKHPKTEHIFTRSNVESEVEVARKKQTCSGHSSSFIISIVQSTGAVLPKLSPATQFLHDFIAPVAKEAGGSGVLDLPNLS